MNILEEITLKGFRCYSEKTFKFNQGINVFVGKNAVGKTSAVEAIYYLSLTRSFKTNKDLELINNKASNLYIRASFNNKDLVEIANDGEKREITFNNNKIGKISSYIGYVAAVAFSPDDLEIVKLDPATRRKFVDTSICQIDKEYLLKLSQLKRIYKEKSAYLHKTLSADVDMDYINVLNNKYCECASYIINKRNEFINELNSLSQNVMSKLNGNEKVSLIYAPNTRANELEEQAVRHINDDINAKTTTWGPLRDEIKILINGVLANTVASQGQIRSITIAIKLALVEYYKKLGKNILIILDDVLSELDKERQNLLLGLLNVEDQIFITTTDLSLIEDKYINVSNIIRL